MNVSNLSDVAQIMEAVLFSLTVMYIAKEARQALNLTKAQYGHSLTQRMYDRYLSSAQNTDFAMFMAKNWDGDDMADHEHWRVTLWMNTLLVDIFDTWDMHDKGLIEKSHLDMRVQAVEGLMKMRLGPAVWQLWKPARDPRFIEWFEEEIFSDLTAQNLSPTSG
ncbi:MAG: hypothetical protein ACJZ4L_04925 [Candidatus Poriferisodalaceae bacterium]|mgnify:FL=1